MSKNCYIMTRMKSHYESRAKTYLNRRTPVIMRIDGKAFHTYTRRLKKPFDEGLIVDMNNTAIYLCEQISGAKCSYVQSDEISLLITDFDSFDTQAWFDYEVQKMVSVSASFAASKFNRLRQSRYLSEIWETDLNNKDILNKFSENIDTISLANFDSRVFNIPKEEVANYFLARQKDAVKNSISSAAQSLYSSKALHGVNQKELQELLFQKGINWNDYPTGQKRGRFIVKNTYVNGEFLDENVIKKENDQYFQKVTAITPSWNLLQTPTIRTKWEVVETPLTFDFEVFSKWLS